MKYTENRDTYAKIATLYYLANMSQNDIADIFNISRFKVSRVLNKCRTMKIVEFKVNPNPNYLSNLADEIKNKLGLTSATIVPSGSTLQESKDNVARITAKYLENNIKDGMKIGLSWGSTIQRIVKFYNKQDTFPNTTFVQLSGSLCIKSINEYGYIDGNIFVQQLAEKTCANQSLFIAPYIVQNPYLKELLYQEPQIKSHIQMFKELDMAIIAIGTDDYTKSVSYISGYLTYEESKKFTDDDMDADLCGTRLTSHGEVKETILTNRVLSIDTEDLYRLSEVCAIGAGAEKACSFIAGCRGGFIKHAIMDEVCALTIISMIADTDKGNELN